VKWACDLKLESDAAMRAFVSGLGVQHITTDYHAVLNDKEVQAVLITSSTESHTVVSSLSKSRISIRILDQH